MDKGTEIKYGIVCMLDALGIRNATIEESKNFIQCVQKMHRAIPSYMQGFSDQVAEKLGEGFKTEASEITAFGDTLVLTWQVDEAEIVKYLPFVGKVISFLTVFGLEHGFLFRGAISVGEFIKSNAMILGPAITDAVSWYESSNFVGTIATPHCAQLVNLADLNEAVWQESFILYNVPMKNVINNKFWTVPWPHSLGWIDNNKNPLVVYYEQTKKLNIPKGVEEKYFNTEAFVRHVMELKQK